MSFAKVYSGQTEGLGAEIIDVEIDIAKGLHKFSVVGLGDKAVEESRDRVSAALKNARFAKSKDFKPPKGYNKKIVVSLAPADVRKEGPLFDVPIALAYLLATSEIRFDTEKKLFIGEVSLDGTVRGVKGVLAIVQKARAAGFREVYVPALNAKEAALVSGIKVYSVSTLSDLVNHLDTKQKRESTLRRQEATRITYTSADAYTTFDEIRGQEHAKSGLVIAAAGGHNVALYGPPGTGKTMLARALASILPQLSPEEVLEVTGIHSIAGVLTDSLVTHPPIRSPHHTASYVSLVGGGTLPKPGEVTLAHRGVLFLDEFPEFDTRVINALRQPLEDGVVSISRARGSAVFPSEFILIAAMNPCPCGYLGTPQCTCQQYVIERYRQKISGPIVDRIDMWIEVGAIAHTELSKKRVVTDTETQKARDAVALARARQFERFRKASRLNGGMSVRGLEAHATLDTESANILNQFAQKENLSPRAYHRIIKLARTVADLQNEKDITKSHLLEVLQYRPKSLQS